MTKVQMQEHADADVETNTEAGAETDAQLTAQAPTYCGQCGKSLAEVAHETCVAHLALEPPRYCGHCARRMIVQVLPNGWTARCSQHGSLNSTASLAVGEL